MKLEWKNPSIQVQEFEPNEYVAVCFSIACDYGESALSVGYGHRVNNRWDQGNVFHTTNEDGTGCGWANNQSIISNGDGTYSMVEIGDNWLDCTFTDSNYRNQSNTVSESYINIIVNTNTTIYWTTSLGDTTWHHKGQVVNPTKDHPNRS